MSRLDRMSIKWRMFGYLLIFIAIPVAILWFFQIVFLENFYIYIKTHDIVNAMDNITENIDSENVDRLIDELARQNDVSIRIYELDGTYLYGSDFGPDNRIATMDPAQIEKYYNEAVSQGGMVAHRFDIMPHNNEFDFENFKGNIDPRESRNGRTIVCAQVLQTQSGEKLMLVNAMITPVNATVRTLRVQLIYITVILLVLSIIIALIMARRISRPIIKTNDRAKELAQGDYDVVFDARGYREILELNQTLNYTTSELSKVERLRRELIANVSHDLRTPLTLVTGYAEMMRDIPGENTPENVQMIIDEANRLSLLVGDLMDISSLQSGSADLKISTFNLTQTVREILTRYAKLTEQDGYTITFEAGQDVSVDADETRISQVIYNLINNAVNYTGADKTVTVRQTLDKEDRTVRISIADTGEGIGEADLPYIWDRYYKVDKTHKRAAIGTGLGLSIVRSTLDMHDGAYGVDSKEGEGSIFWFELNTKH